ncbi:MAG TPA: S9 family peptidase [bacterium]|nr:S9 family peptidase [bacterium]
MRGVFFALALGAVLFLGFAEASAAPHAFSVMDMMAMKRISDPNVSPDGRRIVFVQSEVDLDANKSRTDLWLVDVDGQNLRRLTTNIAGDFNPRWSPDGQHIWFLSTRSGSSQVWRLALAGGEPQQMTDLPLDLSGLSISPDGRYLAFTAEVFPDSSMAATKRMLDAEEARKSSGRVYDRLFIRHWDTWEDGRRAHLFVMPADGGEAKDLVPGMDADAPAGGTDEYTFTPDSRGVVISARNVGREEAWSTDFDLYYVPIDGSAPPRDLTEANEAWDTNPVFSPDGKTLAYLAMARPGYESDRYVIMLRGWPNGEARPLTPNWDRSPGSIVWSRDGRTIYTTANNIGNTALFAVDARSGQAKVLQGKGSFTSPSPAGNRIVCGMSNFKSPLELYSLRPDGGDLRPITRVNAETVANIRMGDYEQFSFKGWNDETVYGYIVKPVDFDSLRTYPVALLIHGGPQGSWDNSFHYRWNAQAYAGAGYAVVTVDFHGSTGYGQAFTDAIRGDWGGKPFVDVQKGLEAALVRSPWMDGARVGALGASYGAYMINWIAGNWPDRFKCLVSHDGNLDERMAYYDTDELWFPEWDHMGKPWENPKGYEEHNPVNFVQNWKTPMLVIHGALDFRVPYPQGIGTFTALQRLGIASRFLYFPDENHWVLKPQNSVLWHQTVIGWLDQWLKPAGETADIGK